MQVQETTTRIDSPGFFRSALVLAFLGVGLLYLGWRSGTLGAQAPILSGLL